MQSIHDNTLLSTEIYPYRESEGRQKVKEKPVVSDNETKKENDNQEDETSKGKKESETKTLCTKQVYQQSNLYTASFMLLRPNFRQQNNPIDSNI